MDMMQRLFTTIAVTVLVCGSVHAQDEAELSDDDRMRIEEIQQILASLDPQSGDIVLQDGLATLHVPEEFYFIDAEGSEAVLVDLWGNPPGQEVLGMLFPADTSPLDAESWAVTIDYSEDGYVSDDDAAEIDYTEMLGDMKRDTRDANEARLDAGYEKVELLGWAEPPHYDASSKKLYWARELRFGDADETTLNYEIRALGRRGTLNLTFIAATSQLGAVNDSRDAVLAMAEFNDGNRYADFDPSVDKVAAYGIGALIAGKLAAKAGFLTAGLLLLKKFGVFIVIGFAALWRKIRGLFRTETLAP